MKALTLRLTPEDHQWFTALAAQQRVPLTALIRQQLALLAQQHHVPQPYVRPKLSSPEEVEARLNALFDDEAIEGDEPPAGFDPDA